MKENWKLFKNLNLLNSSIYIKLHVQNYEYNEMFFFFRKVSCKVITSSSESHREAAFHWSPVKYILWQISSRFKEYKMWIFLEVFL